MTKRVAYCVGVTLAVISVGALTATAQTVAAEYTFDNDLEGWWTLDGYGINVNWKCNAGGWVLQGYGDASVGFDPWVYSPVGLALDLGASPYITLSVNATDVPAGNLTGALFLFTSGWTDVWRLPFTWHEGSQVITLDTSIAQRLWSNSDPQLVVPADGIIDHFRFDLPDAGGNQLSLFAEAIVEIDWIVVSDDPTYSPDSDGDGAPNWWEDMFGFDPDVYNADDDPDFDGLGMTNEFYCATHPRVPDTDGDGLSDAEDDEDGDAIANDEECNVYDSCPLLADAWRQSLSVVDLKYDEQDVLIYGEANDQLTNSRVLAMGDLNDDGKADLALGSRYADGPSNSRADCGETYIFFGGSSLNGTKDTQGIDGDLPDVTIYGADAGDQLTLSGGIIGDVNNDGIDDLVLSSAFGQGPSNSRGNMTGEVCIIFGKSNGTSWPSTIDLATQRDVIIYGPRDTTDLAGERALVIADFNNDGIGDLALGANRLDDHAGRAYIIYGAESWPAVVDLNTGTPERHADVTVYGIRGGGSGIGDRLTNDGSMLAADLNGDAITDLVLASHYASRSTQTSNNDGEGEVYIIYGGTSIPSDIHLATDSGFTTIQSGFYALRLGRERALQAADLNGDGYEDLVMGGYNGSWGAAFTVYGGPGLSSVPLLVLSAGQYDTVTYGSGPVTLWGILAVGNINGDGYRDLVVGTEKGKISVIYGSPTLPWQIPLDTNMEDVAIVNSRIPLERALQVGDVNADGYDDIIVGGGSYCGPYGYPRPLSGGIEVIHGSASLPSTIDLAVAEPDAIVYGATAYDQLSFSPRVVGAFEVDDLTGDGLDDLVFGSYLADGPSESRPSGGEAYVFFGDTEVLEAMLPVISPPGDAEPEDFGTTRTTVDFESGNAPEGSEGSTTTVILIRDNAGTAVVNPSKVADVTWQIESDRTDFEADVTFHYTDDEIAGLDESQLGLYTSPTIDGAYTEVPSTLDANQNEITGQGLTHFSFFIVVDKTDSDFDGEPDGLDSATIRNVADLVILSESGKSTRLDRRTRKITSVSTVTISNGSSQSINTPMHLVVTGVPAGVEMPNATGTTSAGDYYYALSLSALGPGQSADIAITFVYPLTIRIAYGLEFWGLAP